MYLHENYPQGDNGALDMWTEPQHYDPSITPAVQQYRQDLKSALLSSLIKYT